MKGISRHRYGRLPLVFSLILGAVVGPAHADALWRCVGAQGETVFSSSRVGYRNCRRIADTGVQALGSAHNRPPAVVPAQPVVAGLEPAQVTTLPRIHRHARVLRGTVYKVTLANGAVEYTNVRPAGIQARRVDALFTYLSVCYACNPHSDIDWHTVPLRLHAYASAIDPYAVSDKGAQGLMQLMPGTASDMGVRDVFDPAQNILGGARYLAHLLQDFGGNTTLATAAYNAGSAAVRKYGNQVPPYDETQLYVRRVRILLGRYARAEHGAALARNG